MIFSDRLLLKQANAELYGTGYSTGNGLLVMPGYFLNTHYA